MVPRTYPVTSGCRPGRTASKYGFCAEIPATFLQEMLPSHASGAPHVARATPNPVKRSAATLSEGAERRNEVRTPPQSPRGSSNKHQARLCTSTQQTRQGLSLPVEQFRAVRVGQVKAGSALAAPSTHSYSATAML